MIPSTLTLLINSGLVLVGIILTIILIRLGARHEYYYGMSDIQRPLRRWMIIILFFIIAMSFFAGVYNLVVPWLFGI
jgi:hypothetical protein